MVQIIQQMTLLLVKSLLVVLVELELSILLRNPIQVLTLSTKIPQNLRLEKLLALLTLV
jgi:hypothetical protein